MSLRKSLREIPLRTLLILSALLLLAPATMIGLTVWFSQLTLRSNLEAVQNLVQEIDEKINFGILKVRYVTYDDSIKAIYLLKNSIIAEATYQLYQEYHLIFLFSLI